MQVHIWEDPEMSQTRLRTRPSKTTGQRKPKRNAPCKWFKLPRWRDSFSLSPLSIHMYISPPNKCFIWFTTFHLFVEIYFYKADKPWPLTLAVQGLGQHSRRRSLTSVSGQRTEILLWVAAGGGHLRSGWHSHAAWRSRTCETFSSNLTCWLAQGVRVLWGWLSTMTKKLAQTRGF